MSVSSCLNCHFTVVEDFECPNDLRCYVVRSIWLLVGSPITNKSHERGQTRCGFMTLYDTYNQDPENPAQMDTRGPPRSQAWGTCPSVSAWCWTFVHGIHPGPAQNRGMGSSSSGPNTHRRILIGPVFCGTGDRSTIYFEKTS